MGGVEPGRVPKTGETRPWRPQIHGKCTRKGDFHHGWREDNSCAGKTLGGEIANTGRKGGGTSHWKGAGGQGGSHGIVVNWKFGFKEGIKTGNCAPGIEKKRKAPGCLKKRVRFGSWRMAVGTNRKNFQVEMTGDE